MRTNYIRQLAENVASEEMIDSKTEKFITEKLSRSELREFVLYYRRARDKKTLFVKSATPITKDTEEKLLKHFEKKYLSNFIDPKIGAGLVITNNDDIIDLSVMGEIRRFINTIA